MKPVFYNLSFLCKQSFFDKKKEEIFSLFMISLILRKFTVSNELDKSDVRQILALTLEFIPQEFSNVVKNLSEFSQANSSKKVIPENLTENGIQETPEISTCLEQFYKFSKVLQQLVKTIF
jgi:hypothetical protein